MKDGSVLAVGLAKPVEDDHIPFKKKGIPVLDIIDFENLATWHQTSDEPSNVDPASMEKAAKLGLAVVLELLHNPDKAE
jgi:hypothetical protein